MGYITTVVIKNDGLGDFQANQSAFGAAILSGITKANYANKEVDVPFGCRSNYISVHPSRHADDETVYVHTGNTVFNLNPWDLDFKNLLESNSDVLENFVERADKILKEAKSA